MKRHFYFLGIVMLLFLVACGPGETMLPTAPTASSTRPATETETETGSPTAVLPEPTAVSAVSNESGYPAEAETNESGYPVPSETAGDPEGYPPPAATAEPTRATDGVIFSFNEPVTAGQTEISGTAPPLLSIAIVNVTYNGSDLDTGSRDQDGNFTINVSPVPAGVRLGMALAQLDDYPSLDAAVSDLYAYRGDNFMNVPNVGIYFDTLKVDE